MASRVNMTFGGVCAVLIMIASMSPASAADPGVRGAWSTAGELRAIGGGFGMDPDKNVKLLLEQGYNCINFNLLDDRGGAYYHSKVLPLIKIPNVDPDAFPQMVQKCKAAGIKTILYAPYTIDMKDQKLADIYPLRGDGPTSKTLYASMDGPFRETFVAALKEMCAMGGDGLWIDGLSMEFWDETDRHPIQDAMFKRETGYDAPKKEDWSSEAFRHWVKWRYMNHLRNAQYIVDQVHAAYPNVAISFNTHFTTPQIIDPDSSSPWAPMSWSRWREALPIARFPDGVGASNHGKLGPTNGSQWTPLWTHMSSDMNPVRSDVWQPTFMERYSLLCPNTWISGGPADELALHQSILGAFSYRTQVWVQGWILPDDADNRAMYARLNRAVREREAYFGGDAVPYCGVYLGNDTRDFWGLRQRRNEDPRNTDRLFCETYLGLASMLMADHIQFSHIFDNTLDAATLDKYPVIILPNVACLTSEACRALRGYVERGGRLIATYETSLCNEWGDYQKNFQLADLFGVDYVETIDKVAHDPHVWVRELAESEAVPLNDARTGFTWQTRRTIVRLRNVGPEPSPDINGGSPSPDISVLAHETGANNATAPLAEYKFTGDPKQVPVIVRHRVGKGECIYFCDDVSQGYYQSPFRSIRRILKNLIAQTPPPYTVDAPAQVIANAFDQPDKNRLVIHLLNLPPMTTRLFERAQRDTLDELVPVHDVRVTLPSGAARRARLVPTGKDLKIETLPGSSAQRVVVPEITDHEMVVFER